MFCVMENAAPMGQIWHHHLCLVMTGSTMEKTAIKPITVQKSGREVSQNTGQ
jgi:hypothetical protein